MPAPDPLDAALEHLPPASEQRGVPGHDDAMEMSKAIRALTMKIGGATYAQIAAELRYADPSSARDLVMRALRRREAERVDELRAVENARLDADEAELRLIINSRKEPPEPGKQGEHVYPVAARLRAIDTRTRVSARRARMNGMDAPVKVEVSAGIQQELQAALDEYAAALREAQTVAGEVTEVRDDRLGG